MHKKEQELADWEFENNLDVILMLISSHLNSLNPNLMKWFQQYYHYSSISEHFSMDWPAAFSTVLVSSQTIVNHKM